MQKLENHKVLLNDPVGPNEGPWLVMDPVGGSSCADMRKDPDLQTLSEEIFED